MHMLDPFVSDQVTVLGDFSRIRYWWSYLSKQVLHLELHC